MKRRVASEASLVIAALSLLLASVIYLGMRRGMRLHVWADAWLGPVVRFLRQTVRPLHAPDWVRYSLPDALWQLAFCLVMLRVWRDAPPGPRRTLFCLAPALLGVALELGQGVGIVEGVFDPMDLALSIAAIVVALAVGWRRPALAAARAPG